MKSLKIPLIAVAVVAWLGVGLLVARGPQPEIIVPAEVITKVGFLNITNTLITSWVVMAIIIVLSILATRSMSLMPGGIQNFFEGVIAFLLGQMEDIAGEEKARKMFALIATVFIYIIVSNWFGLMPFFNAVGKTEDMGSHITHELFNPHPHDLHLTDEGVYEEDEHFAAWEMQNSGPATVAKSGAKAFGFEVHAGDTPEVTLDRFIVFLAKNFTPDFEASDEDLEHPSNELVVAAAAALESTDGAPKLVMAHAEEDDHGEAAEEEHAEDHHSLVSPALGSTIDGVDWTVSDTKFGLVIPFFRGTFSDINNTLAMGLIAFFMIEFWGFQALGFGYLKKFFNLNGINSFVGILELLSEFIRVISFAFRLFGNIFAGEVLILMLTFLMPFLFVDIIYALELFVGFIQASVFALLILVFGSMAMEHHGEEHEEHGEGGHGPGGDAAGHHVGAAQPH